MPTGSIWSVRNIPCLFGLQGKEGTARKRPLHSLMLFARDAIHACEGRRCLWSSSPSSSAHATKSASNKGPKHIFNIFLICIFLHYIFIMFELFLSRPIFFGPGSQIIVSPFYHVFKFRSYMRNFESWPFNFFLHTWSDLKDEFIFFDQFEISRERNTFCQSFAH